MSQNCMVFLLCCELTRHMGENLFAPDKLSDQVSLQSKRKTGNFRHICVDHNILLLKHLSNLAIQGNVSL